VANLSRAPQAVELDLSQFNGRVPVEMLGATPFPAIGQLTYLLTLPPYGFYWFVLSEDAQPPSWHVNAPEQMVDQVTLVLQNVGGRSELTESARRALTTEVLPNYLARRRWFASKGERIERVNVAYAWPVANVGNTEEVWHCEVEVSLPGRTECYQLPVALLWDRETAEGMPQLMHGLSMARVRRGPRVGVATDGFVVEAYARAIVQALRERITEKVSHGTIRFLPEPGLAEAPLESEPVQWMSAEQSNSSLAYGNTGVLKLVRKVAGGVHPEAEMTRYLTGNGYRHSAALLGEVVRTGADGTPHTLMLLQGYILNQGDGWDWTLDYLGRSIDDALPLTDGHDEFAEALNGYATMVGTLGKRLAELHAVLAQPTDDDAFAPVAAAESQASEWAEEALKSLDEALGLLDARRANATGNFARDIDALLAARGKLPHLVSRLATAAPGSLQTRIHGDFHLGQVLIAQNDTYLVDFEGEPRQPLAFRRRKTSPLRDVAGLLRSIDYAAATVGTDRQERTHATLPPAQAERRAALLDRFRTTAGDAFLNCYQQTMAAAPRAWAASEQLQPLLDLFLLERAAYEVGYEAANRVAWIDLPTSGLARLVRKLLGDDDGKE
jgi:maltose alpha-D-glucosyltransferase / alpha-amylase